MAAKKSRLLKRIFTVLIWAVILGGLGVFSFYDFLLFHTLIEIFTIVVAFAIFLIVLNSSKYIENNYFVYVGVGYFFVAVLDILHTFSYEGLNIIADDNSNIATQFWIAGRYFQSAILLSAPFFVRKKVRIWQLFACFSLVSAILVYLIFGGIFPECYVKGSGLTAFKLFSEYIIIILLLLSVFYLSLNRGAFNRKVYRQLVMAILLTAVSELSFTFYIDVYGLFNIIGHFFRVAAFYVFYKAIVEVSLREPYSLLFRELKKHEQLLLETSRTAKVGGWWLNWQSGELIWSEEIYNIHEVEQGFVPSLEEAIKFYPEPFSGELKDALERAVAGEQRQELELELVTAKGNHIWVRDIIMRRQEKDGTVTLFGTFQDITQEKLDKSELVRLNTLLTSRNNEMERMIHVVSHDLRSPLVNIQGFSREVLLSVEQIEKLIGDREKVEAEDLLRIREIIETEIKGDLEYVKSSVERMDSLLSGLLKVSRAGREEFVPEYVDMNDEIDKIIRSVGSQIRRTGAVVEVGDLPVCYGDRSQVSQVFTNLIDNAIKYLDPGRKGLIRIRGEAEGIYCFYTVEDNGIGIDKLHHEKIFRIFHRAVKDSQVKGEGIGLTIVSEIVERCGGNIEVESEPGEGTKFRVMLPAGPVP